jgi:hypothetical protein
MVSPTSPVLILNHPRAASIGGYFSAVGYNRETGVADIADNWSEEFTAIEIINGGDITTAESATLPDWYSFLNRGKKFTGSSGSDVHKITGTIGNVRNYVATATDDPALVDPDAYAAAVKAQKLLVTTGPFMNVSIEGKGMGELVTVTSGPVKLNIKVQAPRWMDASRLSVVANGKQVAAYTLDPSTEDPLNRVIRYNGVVEFTPEIDTWYVVFVEGDHGAPPVASARPYAFTNPIYVDRDGNGKFDPPIK